MLDGALKNNPERAAAVFFKRLPATYLKY